MLAAYVCHGCSDSSPQCSWCTYAYGHSHRLSMSVWVNILKKSCISKCLSEWVVNYSVSPRPLQFILPVTLALVAELADSLYTTGSSLASSLLNFPILLLLNLYPFLPAYPPPPQWLPLGEAHLLWTANAHFLECWFTLLLTHTWDDLASCNSSTHHVQNCTMFGQFPLRNYGCRRLKIMAGYMAVYRRLCLSGFPVDLSLYLPGIGAISPFAPESDLLRRPFFFEVASRDAITWARFGKEPGNCQMSKTILSTLISHFYHRQGIEPICI